jgi:hypothetical protein
MNLDTLEQDFRHTADDIKTRVAEAVEAATAPAAQVLSQLSGNSVVAAILKAEHLSPGTVDAIAEFIGKVDAEAAKLAGDSANQVTPGPLVADEPTTDTPPVPPAPAGPQVAGVA